jgi:AraC-like DNA-binding protein
MTRVIEVTRDGETWPSARKSGIVVSRARRVTGRSRTSLISFKTVQNGEVVYSAGGARHILEPGSIFLVGHDTDLRVSTRNDSFVSGACPHFTLECLDKAARRNGLRFDPSVLRRRAYRLPRSYAGMADAAERLTSTAGANMRAWEWNKQIEALKLEIITTFENLWTRSDTVPATKSSTREAIVGKLAFAEDFLRSNVKFPFRVADAAAAAGISESHFSRLFAKVYGQSPSSYHAKLRALAAIGEISSGKASIQEAAVEFGYADYPSFAKAMRRALGIWPSDITRKGAAALSD